MLWKRVYRYYWHLCTGLNVRVLLAAFSYHTHWSRRAMWLTSSCHGTLTSSQTLRLNADFHCLLDRTLTSTHALHFCYKLTANYWPHYHHHTNTAPRYKHTASCWHTNVASRYKLTESCTLTRGSNTDVVNWWQALPVKHLSTNRPALSCPLPVLHSQIGMK